MALVSNSIVCTLRNLDPKVMGKLPQTNEEGPEHPLDV